MSILIGWKITLIHARDFMLALLTIMYSTLVIFLKATKDKSQNRISLKQQRFLKNDKSESFLDFVSVDMLNLVSRYVKILSSISKFPSKFEGNSGNKYQNA